MSAPINEFIRSTRTTLVTIGCCLTTRPFSAKYRKGIFQEYEGFAAAVVKEQELIASIIAESEKTAEDREKDRVKALKQRWQEEWGDSPSPSGIRQVRRRMSHKTSEDMAPQKSKNLIPIKEEYEPSSLVHKIFGVVNVDSDSEENNISTSTSSRAPMPRSYLDDAEGPGQRENEYDEE